MSHKKCLCVIAERKLRRSRRVPQQKARGADYDKQLNIWLDSHVKIARDHMSEWSHVTLSAYLRVIGVRIARPSIFKMFLSKLIASEGKEIAPPPVIVEMPIIDVAMVVEKARMIHESKIHRKPLTGAKYYDLVRIDKDIEHMRNGPLQLSNFQWIYAYTKYPGVGLLIGDKDKAFREHMPVRAHFPEIVIDIIRIRGLSVVYSDYVTYSYKGGGGENLFVVGENESYRVHSYIFNMIYFPGVDCFNFVSPVGMMEFQRYCKDEEFGDIYIAASLSGFEPVVLDMYDQIIFFFPFFRLVCLKFTQIRYIQLGFRRLVGTFEVLLYVLKFCGNYIASLGTLQGSARLLSSIVQYGWRVSFKVHPEIALKFLYLFMVCNTFGTASKDIFSDFLLEPKRRIKNKIVEKLALLFVCMLVRSTGQYIGWSGESEYMENHSLDPGAEQKGQGYGLL